MCLDRSASIGGASDYRRGRYALRCRSWRAGNIAGFVLGFGVIGIVVHILIGGFFGSPLAQSPTLIGAALMAAVFIATVVELVLTLVFYRRGL